MRSAWLVCDWPAQSVQPAIFAQCQRFPVFGGYFGVATRRGVGRPAGLWQSTNLAKATHRGKIFRANLGKRPSIIAGHRVDKNHEAMD